MYFGNRIDAFRFAKLVLAKIDQLKAGNHHAGLVVYVTNLNVFSRIPNPNCLPENRHFRPRFTRVFEKVDTLVWDIWAIDD